jgi:hypothetical protein
MHLPINVKSPNNISKWHMGINSAFRGLTEILAFWFLTPSVLKVHTNLSAEYTAAVFRVEVSGVCCGQFMWARL